jgi:hypothetical protein
VYVHVHTPSESVLAGRIVETVRSAASDATVSLTTGASEPAAAAGAPERVSVVLVDGGTTTPPAVLEGPGPTLALVAPDGSVPDAVPRVSVDPAAPEPALDALRAWIEAVAAGADPAAVEGIGPAAGAAVVGGLAGLVLGGLLGDDGGSVGDGFL